MTKSIDRRAVLRSTLVIGAISATPIATGAATAAELAPGSDVDLFALISAVREAKSRRWAATIAMHEAARRVPNVPPPHALIATEDDARLWISVKLGEPVPPEIIQEYRTFRALHPGRGNSRRLLSRDLDSYPLKDEGDRELMTFIRQDAEREARADELIAADDEWRQARHQAKVDSGAWAAVERQKALLGEELDLQEEIPGTPAQTEPGARAKIALVADYHGDPTFGDDDEQFFDWETGFRILSSAALDLKRLQGAGATV